jgi:hypothetical protein
MDGETMAGQNSKVQTIVKRSECSHHQYVLLLDFDAITCMFLSCLLTMLVVELRETV